MSDGMRTRPPIGSMWTPPYGEDDPVKVVITAWDEDRRESYDIPAGEMLLVTRPALKVPVDRGREYPVEVINSGGRRLTLGVWDFSPTGDDEGYGLIRVA